MSRVNITWEGMSALMWTLTGFSVVLSGGKYAIRMYVRGRLYWDDLAHGIAVIFLIAFVAIAQAMFVPATEVIDVPPGTPPPIDAAITFRKLQEPLSITWAISLWAVKYSFLLFYKLLFWVSPVFRKAWWVVAVFTFLTFWVVIAGNLTECGSASDIYNLEACSRTLNYQRQILIYICALNVATDVAIMVLPVFMLSQVQIRLSQKIGLSVIFCIALVTIALDILRTVESIYGGAYADSILYSVLEATFTVIISCLPTYRALLGVERRVKTDSYLHWSFPNRKPTEGVKSGLVDPATNRGQLEEYPLGSIESLPRTEQAPGRL